MGNFSIYLNKEEQQKISNIADLCNVPKGSVIRIVIRNFEESYLKDVVEAYKNNM